MIKFDVELDLTEEELIEGLNKNLQSSLARTVSKVGDHSKLLAANKLKAGLKHWQDGFKMDKIDEGFWIISINGKLANMMEDGFGTGAIKDLILNKNRHNANKAQGKDYVDVPIALDADEAVQRVGISMEQFSDMDEVVRHVNTSDWAKGGTKKEKKITQRVKDVIRNRQQNDQAEKFVTIRRLTPDSEGWPKNPFEGAKILDQLDSFIEKAFEESLKEIM